MYSVSKDQNWQTLKVNFFISNRNDIEIGDASYVLGGNNNISYALVKPCNNTGFLRVNAFLQEFSGSTTDDHIGFILSSPSITGRVVNYQFSKNSTVKITKLTLTLVIFNAMAPTLRFEDGIVTQTYLNSLIEVTLPNKVFGEIRSFLAGFSSFSVQSNSSLSLVSIVNDSYIMQIGPNSKDCTINYLSVSYLIISFSQCGFCDGNYFIYQGNCVEKCPTGTKANGFNCDPIVCAKDEILVGDNCVKKCNALDN